MVSRGRLCQTECFYFGTFWTCFIALYYITWRNQSTSPQQFPPAIGTAPPPLNRWRPDNNSFVKDSVEGNGTSYAGTNQESDFILTPDNGFYIFDAVASRVYPGQSGGVLVVSGWGRSHPGASRGAYKCCVQGADSQMLSIPAQRRHKMGNGGKLHATQFACPNPFFNSTKKPRVLAVSLVANNMLCPENSKFYRKVVHSTTVPENNNLFAMCAKVIHGTKSATELVEWIEYQKYFGIDKILVYQAENLNEPAKRVLEYYKKAGLMEIRHFGNVPENGTFPRALSDKGHYKWNDDYVVLYDAQERLKDYKYVLLMDTDEFIYPTTTTTVISSFKQMMEYFLQRWPESVGFRFETQLYRTTWGQTNPREDMLITQYLNRTGSRIDRPKTAFLSERLEPGSARIHPLRPRKPYKGPNDVPNTEAVLKHYRTCEPKALQDQTFLPNKCLGERRFPDDSMKKMAEKIRPNVNQVKKLLGL